MKFIDFYDLEWHDAAILKIVVDRSYPESHNQIRLDVQWPDSDNTFSSIYFVDFLLSVLLNSSQLMILFVLFALETPLTFHVRDSKLLAWSMWLGCLMIRPFCFRV